MKKGIRFIVGLILFLSGLAILFYPRVGQQIYRWQAEKIIQDYRARIEDDSIRKEEDMEWLYQLIVAYNTELFEERQQKLIDPFSYEQTDLNLVEFGFDENIIGFLEIPKMELKLPVYLGASQDNLKLGAAQLAQTSIPIGGNNTNAVIAAHRGYSQASMFRDIELLEYKDPVYLTNFRETLKYQVHEVAVILPDEIEKILIQEGRDLLTLITCHPYRNNYQRYVVYCERIPE